MFTDVIYDTFFVNGENLCNSTTLQYYLYRKDLIL